MNFNIFNINEGIVKSLQYLFFEILLKKLFSEECKVPRTLFAARKVAGSAKYEQSYMV